MKAINNFLMESRRLIVYLDMDGCISDFNRQFESLGHGKVSDVSDEELWPPINKAGVKFWSEMPWTPDGKELWAYVKQFNPIILSTPSTHNSSRIGKKIWVKKNLGSDVTLILTFRKEKFANPNAILIDDRDVNLIPWRKAGGIAVAHKDAKTTIQKLKKLLK
jgi:hypothetical protein